MELSLLLIMYNGIVVCDPCMVCVYPTNILPVRPKVSVNNRNPSRDYEVFNPPTPITPLHIILSYLHHIHNYVCVIAALREVPKILPNICFYGDSITINGAEVTGYTTLCR